MSRLTKVENLASVVVTIHNTYRRWLDALARRLEGKVAVKAQGYVTV